MPAFKKWPFCIAAFFISSTLCYADNFSVFISGGPSFSRLNNGEFVTLNYFIVNSYQTHTTTQVKGNFGIGISHSFENVLNKNHKVSLGLAGYFTNLGTIKGIEHPLINEGLFDTLNYKFHANSNTLMLESRWFYTLYNWQPFALIGIGNAWNKLSNYSEVPTNPASSATPMLSTYNNQTKNAFAYELGLGMEHQLYEDTIHHIRYAASLDYRYFNFGKGQLAILPAQTTTDHLQINNIFTQSVMFSLKASFY